jgi:hypothetical protein
MSFIHIRALTAQLHGRSPKSIEYKYQNVSGVLDDLGFPYIDGFKPARNYQKRLFPEIVLEHMGAESAQIQGIEQSLDEVPAEPPSPLIFDACEVPPPSRDVLDARPGRRRLTRSRPWTCALDACLMNDT